MIERAVWTGLAAILTVSLGSALSLSSSPTSSWGGWLFGFLYAAAAAGVFVSTSGDSERSGSTTRRPRYPLNFGAAVTGLASLGALWYLEGVWIAFVVGGPAMIGLTVAATVFDPVGRSESPRPEAEPTWLWPATRLAIELLFLAMVLPLVGFTSAGASLSLYPWRVTAALLVPALCYVLATHAGILAVSDLGHHERRDRIFTAGMTLVSLGGVLVAGRFLPGSSEIRLLGISVATLVAFVGLAAPLHPSAETGRRLGEILVSISFLTLIAGSSLLYALI